MKSNLIFLLLIMGYTTYAQTNPAITSWLQNTNNTKGRYYLIGNPTPISLTVDANVQLVQYSANYVYVKATGIPAFVTGPFATGPVTTAANNNYVIKMPLTPTVATTKTLVGNGTIAAFINGTVAYNAGDAGSYNNQNRWHSNAVYFENIGFDCAHGHPGPMTSDYHHHQNPSAFNVEAVPSSSICNIYLADGLYVPNAATHGPLIGFAADGFPIYGAYGYTNPLDATTPIKRMTSSYQLRNITTRTTLPDGTAAVGPTLTEMVQIMGPGQPKIQAILGAYLEDFEYVAGLGDLDENNGRFSITPEYPNGIYCYFATIDENNKPVYPYLLGKSYHGVVQASTHATINETVTTYIPTVSSSDNSLEQIGLSLFPNPSSELIVVQSYSPTVIDLKIELFDINGKLVLVDTLKQGSTMCYLNLETVYAGTYFVKISDDKNSITKKVVVTH
jgi:YHYH protein/Secretion system C-terminal sorting domain